MRIEYDEKGWPVRAVVWPPDPPFVSLKQMERAHLEYKNSLPMPAMREWAKARGLIK